MQRWLSISVVGLGVVGFGFGSGVPAAQAASPVSLVLKDHHFVPDHVQVPAGQRFRIEVTNRDDTAAELESYDMKFEKIIVPGGTVSVSAGPLHPGTYKFFDDYHPDTAIGTVTASGKE